MIIGRRGFVGGLLSLLASPAIVRAASLMPVKAIDLGIMLPSWCPPGFVPKVGQTISASQFPGLFNKTDWFYPPYMGRKKAELPVVVIPNGDERVCVELLASDPQIAPNGRVLKPGWSVKAMVDSAEFAKSYPDVALDGGKSDGALVWFGQLHTLANGGP